MSKRMKKTLSILLAVCLIVSFVPLKANAMLGALTDPVVWPKDSSSINEAIYNKYHAYWIENDYIRFYLLKGTDAAKDTNTYLVTVPTLTAASAKEAYDMVFTKGVYQRPYFQANTKEISPDSWSIRTANDNTWIEISYTFKPHTQIKKLSQKYTYTVTTKYYIVGLDEGKLEGFTDAGVVYDDENDVGTYGIRCEIEAGYDENTTVGYSDILSLSFNTEMVNFNRMGHENAEVGAGLYMSTATGSSAEGYTHTTTGIATNMFHVKTNELSWWSTPSSGMNSKGTAITEVLTKGYPWANPFTALSDLYSVYVDGHYFNNTGLVVDPLPEYFSATASGNVTLEMPLPLNGKQNNLRMYGNTLWGFRDLHAMDADNFTPSDDVEVSVAAQELGIFKVGDGYRAIPADALTGFKTVTSAYDEPVTVIRGNFEEKNNRYVFTSGAAALSNTVTAVWSVSSGSFSVGKDGSVELRGVNLNAPTFKFYQDNGRNGLTLEPSKEGLVATIEPTSNSAVIAIDIPGTKIALEGAVMEPKGNIHFTGQAEFTLFKGAELTMGELGYGLENGKFKMNGISAYGRIDTTEMLGLEMGNIEGEINTFADFYRFALELNVFDLFEAEAELELMRSELTGSLMPNKLYFFVGSEAAKIPLVPPVVVANISGAGGGFDHLAETLNGDFFAIPPINLTVTGRGDILHTIEAKASYTFGPAYYKMEAEDIGIKVLKKLNLLDEFSIYEGVQGETRKYKGTDYTGLSALGGASAHLSIPKKSKVLQAGGEINASVFAGLDSYRNPTKVYIVADMNGGVEGSVHIPEDVKTIGGKKLAGAALDFYLGASSVVQVRNTDFLGAVTSAFRNFRIYGGVKKETDWSIAAWRVYYIFPNNDVGFDVEGFWADLPEWDWSDHIPNSYSAYSVEDEGALMLVSVSMDPLYASVTENDVDNGIALLSSDYSKTVTLQANAGQSLPSDATVLLMATPADGTDIEAFMNSLTVEKGGQSIALTMPTYNENGEITNESALNVITLKNGEGKDCVMIGLGKNASVGDSWTVTSSLADFEASLNASMPFDSLDVSLSGYTLSGSVKNASDADYVLATYFGSERGETEYIIEHAEITDPDHISVAIPQSGTMVPTGNYYVTAKLLSKTTVEVEDDAGNLDEQEILLPVDTVELGSVSYTNTAQPDAPGAAAIKPIGNEIMNASWSEVMNADGYKVTIYQKQNGVYVDTGKGYSYDAADIKAGKISGIAYDSNSNAFTLDMALTVGGTDIDENREALTGSTALEAGKNYKIGVQAYKYMTEAGERIENSQVYSTETLSNNSVLPAYTPVDINIVLKTLKGSGYSSASVEQTVHGVFTCVTGGGDDNTWYLTPSSPDATATYTVTRMDTGVVYTPGSGNEYFIDNEGIIGSVMFKIEAVVDRGTYTDITTKYLLVEKDDTAPMISLDHTVVFADPETGAYTIAGLAEPNATVCLSMSDEYGYPVNAKVTAGADGKFSYTGQLALTIERTQFDENGDLVIDDNGDPIMISVPNEAGAIVTLLAEDENENRSAAVSAMVAFNRTTNTFTVTLNTNGGTINSGNVAEYTYGQGATLPTDVTKTGYTFAGWFDNAALTGTPVTAIGATDTDNKEYWAKWSDVDAPVISGIETGKTYCAPQTVTVSDNDTIVSVTVNGNAVTPDANGQFTLNPATGTQTVIATDNAGNETTVAVTVNAGHTDESPKDHKCDFCDANVGVHKDANKDHVCDYGCTESIGEHKAADGKHTCDYCGAEMTTCKDDDKNHLCDTCGITLSQHSGGAATCTSKAICDYCGKEYGEVDSTKHNLEKIPAKPATVTETGNKEYWHCKDCGSSFSDQDGKNGIEVKDTVTQKLPPEVIEGTGQSLTAGDKKDLTFRSNAAFSDFIRVELDGSTLDAANYTVKEGSTIVTLKADYVASLSAGEHTIGIVSASGTASATFTITARTDNGNSQTGDNSHLALWAVLAFASGSLLVVTGVSGSKKKHSAK